MPTVSDLFDPRGVTRKRDLCTCGEPRQGNSVRCLDCLLDEQEAWAPITDEEEPA
jgi:hypothetical protein